jgi:purine-binding chemotaxis protein CheW
VTVVEQLCTFHLDDYHLGVDVHVVQEILRLHEITQVPLAGESLVGLINLRGHIVPAISLRSLLHIPTRNARRGNVQIVLRRSDRCLSLVVDSIGDVITPSPEQFEEPPRNLDPGIRRVTRGLYKLDPKLLLVIDTDKILDPSLTVTP